LTQENDYKLRRHNVKRQSSKVKHTNTNTTANQVPKTTSTDRSNNLNEIFLKPNSESDKDSIARVSLKSTDEFYLNLNTRKPTNTFKKIANIFDRFTFNLISINSTTSKNEMQNEAKALQVIIIVFIIFLIAWLPFCLFNIASVFYQSHSINLILTWLAHLNYVSSALNPIIYTIFNKKFRKNFVKILLCKKMDTKNSQLERSSSTKKSVRL
jgi:hypothetical protein